MTDEGGTRAGPSDLVLVEARAAGMTFSAIAQRYGGSERNNRRRCATPEMRAMIADRHAEMTGEVLGALGAHMGDAVHAIVTVLREGTPSERLRAAQLVLAEFDRLRKTSEVHDELVDLREVVGALRAHGPTEGPPGDMGQETAS